MPMSLRQAMEGTGHRNIVVFICEFIKDLLDPLRTYIIRWLLTVNHLYTDAKAVNHYLRFLLGIYSVKSIS
jgi:hypothetical protein